MSLRFRCPDFSFGPAPAHSFFPLAVFRLARCALGIFFEFIRRFLGNYSSFPLALYTLAPLIRVAYFPLLLFSGILFSSRSLKQYHRVPHFPVPTKTGALFLKLLREPSLPLFFNLLLVASAVFVRLVLFESLRVLQDPIPDLIYFFFENKPPLSLPPPFCRTVPPLFGDFVWVLAQAGGSRLFFFTRALPSDLIDSSVPLRFFSLNLVAFVPSPLGHPSPPPCSFINSPPISPVIVSGPPWNFVFVSCPYDGPEETLAQSIFALRDR